MKKLNEEIDKETIDIVCRYLKQCELIKRKA